MTRESHGYRKPCKQYKSKPLKKNNKPVVGLDKRFTQKCVKYGQPPNYYLYGYMNSSVGLQITPSLSNDLLNMVFYTTKRGPVIQTIIANDICNKLIDRYIIIEFPDGRVVKMDGSTINEISHLIYKKQKKSHKFYYTTFRFSELYINFDHGVYPFASHYAYIKVSFPKLKEI
jgi:hypothetical protein